MYRRKQGTRDNRLMRKRWRSGRRIICNALKRSVIVLLLLVYGGVSRFCCLLVHDSDPIDLKDLRNRDEIRETRRDREKETPNSKD